MQRRKPVASIARRGRISSAYAYERCVKRGRRSGMAGTVYILDQTNWSDGIVDRLRAGGLMALRVRDQDEAERLIRRRPPDQVIVVESQPGLDALAMLSWLRGFTEALIAIVPDGSDDGRILAGFDAGADDVVPPDCDPAVLVARIRSLLRRVGWLPPETGPRITIGDVTVDTGMHRVLVRQRPVHLTPLEFALLHTLMRDPGVVYSREDLLDFVWGSRDLAVERTIDAHIWKLRRKIEPNAGHPSHIVSVPRLGYRFRRPDERRSFAQAIAG